jgi:hypothetical protein
MPIGLYVKCLLFMSHFYEIEIFSENTLTYTFVEICAVEAEWLHADGNRQTDRQTDRHSEANIHLSQFC